VTDGPFAETKEQLGGFGVIEAIDLNDAIQLMSKHPSLKLGVVEIRPADNLTGMIRESERRRAATIADDGRENREGTSPIVGINAATIRVGFVRNAKSSARMRSLGITWIQQRQSSKSIKPNSRLTLTANRQAYAENNPFPVVRRQSRRGSAIL